MKDEDKTKEQLIDELTELRQQVADLKAVRIEKMQAEETLQRYAKRLEILHQIDRAILAAQSPEEIAQAALGHIRQLVPCGRASVTVFDLEAYTAVRIALAAGADDFVPKIKVNTDLLLAIHRVVQVGLAQEKTTQASDLKKPLI